MADTNRLYSNVSPFDNFEGIVYHGFDEEPNILSLHVRRCADEYI